MIKVVLFAGVLLVLANGGADGADCCSSYTDAFNVYHESVLCADYCCWDISLTEYKYCCSDSWRQIPASKNQNEACVKSWIAEHIWVPIVAGIVGLVLIIGVCTCCCCCGCCGCCRRSPQPVVIHSTGMMPASTTVAMTNQTVMSQMNPNPAHYGYDQ